MTQSEQILEYIDGLLDSQSEQALFDAMARQPELRSALRQFISIGEAVRGDREAFTPPADVERAVLEGIGLTVRDRAWRGIGAGFLGRFGAGTRGLFGMIASFIIGALLAGGSVFMMMDDTSAAEGDIAARSGSATSVPAGSGASGSNGAARSDAASQLDGAGGTTPPKIAQNGAAISAPSSTSSAASNGGENRSHDAASTALTERRDGAVRTTTRSTATRRGPHGASTSRIDASTSQSSAANDRSSDGSSAAKSDGASVVPSDGGVRTTDSDGVSRTTNNSGASARSIISEPASSSSASDAAGDIRTVMGTQLRSSTASLPPAAHDPIAPARAPAGISASSSMDTPFDMTPGGEGRRGLAFEFRGQAGQSLNHSSARSRGMLGEAAYAGGIYWHLDRSLALSAEGGLEGYDQILYYSTASSDTLRVDQRPTYLWSGIGLRYSIGEFSSFNPFVQTTIGGTSVGPMARLRLGTYYDIGANFGLSLSGEFSSLVYSFRDQRMMSGRWGVTVGAEYSVEISQ